MKDYILRLSATQRYEICEGGVSELGYGVSVDGELFPPKDRAPEEYIKEIRDDWKQDVYEWYVVAAPQHGVEIISAHNEYDACMIYIGDDIEGQFDGVSVRAIGTIKEIDI